MLGKFLPDAGKCWRSERQLWQSSKCTQLGAAVGKETVKFPRYGLRALRRELPDNLKPAVFWDVAPSSL